MSDALRWLGCVTRRFSTRHDRTSFTHHFIGFMVVAKCESTGSFMADVVFSSHKFTKINKCGAVCYKFT